MPDERPVVLVSRHVPRREGTAAGRALWALRDGLTSLGRDVTVWSWSPDPDEDDDLPDRCHVVGLPSRSRWRTRAAALRRPRGDARALDLPVDPSAIVVADDPVSWPAIAHLEPVLTVHHAVRLDAAALGRRDPALLQDLRFERTVARYPRLEVLSGRVALALARPDAAVVPIAVPMPGPDDELPLPTRPVACLLADWRWHPNRVALDRLLTAWPDVRARVPAARLVLAGRGDPRVGSLTGVEWRGEVADSRDVLADAVAVAFPCPASSGPKVKALEALVHGRALVTTRAGLEGLHITTTPRTGTYTDLLSATLADPDAAAARAADVAVQVRQAHSPVAAARARLPRWTAPRAAPARPDRR